MDGPFQIGCGECGFKADTPEQYIDHVLVTEHAPKDLLATLRDGSGYATFARQLQAIQEHGARGEMPPDSRLLSPDEVPDEVRAKYEEVERRELAEFAATLTTPELIARIGVVAEMMERMASVRPPSQSGSEIILSIRAAELRLREYVTAELGIIEAFMAAVNDRAENDIATGGPIEGAHHRAMQAVRKEWPSRPPAPGVKNDAVD